MATPIPSQLSANARALIALLRGAKTDAVVPYAQLTAAIGVDVRAEAKHTLSRARKVLLREGIRFDVVTDVGLKRMTDAEVVRSGDQSIASIGRKVRGEIQKMAAVNDYDALTSDERIKLNTTRSMLGAMKLVTKTSTVSVIEGAVGQVQKQLGAGDVLRACGKTIERMQQKK